MRGRQKKGEMHRGTEAGRQRNNIEKNVESAGFGDLWGRERGQGGSAHLTARTDIWVRIPTSLKNPQNGRHSAGEWPTHSCAPKKSCCKLES
jgi:hypothetical protein